MPFSCPFLPLCSFIVFPVFLLHFSWVNIAWPFVCSVRDLLYLCSSVTLALLFGGHPNRVCEVAYVDPTAVSCNRHTIRANVNKSSDVNVCHVNDSYKVHNLPFFTVQIFHWAVSLFPLRGRIFARKR